MQLDKNEFILKTGQTDFTNIRWAPVVNCVVEYEGKILLVKRSTKLRLYPGYWNGISGFLDDNLSLEEKVREEVREELGIMENDIELITLGEIFDQNESKYNKTWIVHPVLIKVKTNQIKTDWEAEDYKWVSPTDLNSFDLLPGFDKVLKKLQKLL